MDKPGGELYQRRQSSKRACGQAAQAGAQTAELADRSKANHRKAACGDADSASLQAFLEQKWHPDYDDDTSCPIYFLRTTYCLIKNFLVGYLVLHIMKDLTGYNPLDL